MKRFRMTLSLWLFVVAVFTLPMQASAADETPIAQVYTFDTHGNTAAWLEAAKPILARLKVINPKQNVHIHESQFAGTDVGRINLVAEHPSMAHMEQVGLKADKDKELAGLLAKMANIEMDLISQSLLVDRAPDQVRKSSSPVEEVYSIDTHGKNDAYVEGSKKLHAAIYKKIPDISVRVWEATFAGESTGMIYIVVGYQSMADMERIGAQIEGDEQIQNLFAERDRVGATIISTGLSTDITP